MAGPVVCRSGMCVRGEEMELQCTGTERCVWAEWSHLHGERERDMAGNAIAWVHWVGHICVRGQQLVGLEVHVCKGRCGALVLGRDAHLLCCVGSGMYVCWDHGMVWVGRDLKDHLVHLLLDQAAQSPVQPGLDAHGNQGCTCTRAAWGHVHEAGACVHTGGSIGTVGLGMCIRGDVGLQGVKAGMH